MFNWPYRYKKRIGIIGLVVICAVILSFIVGVVVWVIGGLGTIAFEKELYAKELNNPYVNSDFNSWHTVTIDQVELKFPENWQFIKENEIMTIFQDGEKIAEGINLNASSDEAFLSQTLNTPVTTVHYNIISSLLGSHCGELHINEEEQLRGYYLELGESSLLFYFPVDKNEKTELISIVEAIIYYHQYLQ